MPGGGGERARGEDDGAADDALPLGVISAPPPPDEVVVDATLRRELRTDAERLQETLNAQTIERQSKQAKFEQLQMSLQMISCETAPATATEVPDPPRFPTPQRAARPEPLCADLRDPGAADYGIPAAPALGDRAGDAGRAEVRGGAAEHVDAGQGRAARGDTGDQRCAQAPPAARPQADASLCAAFQRALDQANREHSRVSTPPSCPHRCLDRSG